MASIVVRLPTGFAYDEAGNVVLDPDAQIRETIAYFFETFSACRLGVPDGEGVSEGGPLFSISALGGATVFQPLTASSAMRVLNNPRYAGVYVYGRRRYRRAADGSEEDPAKARIQ